MAGVALNQVGVGLAGVSIVNRFLFSVRGTRPAAPKRLGSRSNNLRHLAYIHGGNRVRLVGSGGVAAPKPSSALAPFSAASPALGVLVCPNLQRCRVVNMLREHPSVPGRCMDTLVRTNWTDPGTTWNNIVLWNFSCAALPGGGTI